MNEQERQDGPWLVDGGVNLVGVTEGAMNKGEEKELTWRFGKRMTKLDLVKEIEEFIGPTEKLWKASKKTLLKILDTLDP